MACKITESFVKISSKHRPGTKRTGNRGVTIHETGNTNKGANAEGHRQYYHSLANGNGGSSIGYHYFVDDTQAFLMHPFDEIAWTCGDGSGDGNMKTVSIEICVNSDGNFNTARANGAYVAAVALKKMGFKKVVAVTGSDGQGNKSNANLFQHRSWMVKNCPENIRNRGLWNDFVKTTQTELNKLWGDTSNSSNVNTNTDKLYRVRKSWSDTKSQIGAYKTLENAKKACKTAYKVYDYKGKEVYSNANTTTSTFTSYKVKITYKDGLNIRKGAGVNYTKTNDECRYGFTYTIVDEKTVSNQKWGKLKSGVGWICLTGFTIKV